ncbi:MAG: hypothetical protein RLZZ341_2152, partial [Pseudomonadota bacterium]
MPPMSPVPFPDAASLARPLPLLGWLSPATFMRRHWQRKPLLVRQAWPGVAPPLARPALPSPRRCTRRDSTPSCCASANSAGRARGGATPGQAWRTSSGFLCQWRRMKV